MKTSNTTTKFISVLLTLSFIMSLCPITGFAASSYETDFSSVTVTGENKIFVGETEMFNQIEIVSDGSNRIAKGTVSNAFFFKAGSVTISDMAVLEFDVNIGESETFELLISGNSNYRVLNYLSSKGFYNYNDSTDVFVPKEEVSLGWHNVKVLIKYGENYSIFIDDELVAERYSLTTTMSSNRKGIKFTTTSGVDNLKYYNRALPVPYDTGFKAQPKIGSVVFGEAAAHALTDISSDAYKTVYSYLISDTRNGTYSPIVPTSDVYVTSEGGLAIFDASYEGKWLKVCAKITDNTGGNASYTICSEPSQIGSCDELNLTDGFGTEDVRFKLTSSLTGSVNWELSPSAVPGVTLLADGLINVTSLPLGDVYAVASKANGEKEMKKLNFISASSDGTPLSDEVYPVIFKAEIDTAVTTTLSAGSLDIALASSGEISFKLVFEGGKYYAFADNELIETGESDLKPRGITANAGSLTSYYAGSPLVTDGAFIKKVVPSSVYEGTSATVDYAFYNESGPLPSSYTVEWYLDGEKVHTGESYPVPFGKIGSSVYAEITASNTVGGRTNTATIDSQYDLDIISDGIYEVELNSTDKDAYAFLTGEDKSVYVSDMSGGAVTINSAPGQKYTMYFVNKSDLALRGMPVYIDGFSYSDASISDPHINYLTRKGAGLETNTACLFEKPYTKAELMGVLSASSDGDISDIFRDIFVTEAFLTSYSDSISPDFGRFNLISVKGDGSARETELYKNKAKLFNTALHFTYPGFASLTKDTLDISSDGAASLCTALDLISNKQNVCSLVGTKAEYFPSAVRFATVLEMSAKSDGAINLLKSELDLVGVTSGFTAILKSASSYSTIVSGVNCLSGLESAAGSMIEKILLSETVNTLNYKNLKPFFKGYLGSTVYDTASETLQNYAAECVHKKTYANLAALKSAVEYAIQNPPKDETVYEGGGGGISGGPVQSGSISSGTPVQTPVSNTPFSDITPAHWAYNYVLYMNQRGIMSGYNGLCRPEDSITRAEYIKILNLAFSLGEGYTDAFGDVGENDWFAPFVGGAYNSGIIKGNGLGFNPNGSITREDAAVMLWRLLKLKGFEEKGSIHGFADSDFADYSIQSVAELTALGIINGISETAFAPKENITRAQASKLLYFAMNMGGDIR